MANKEHLDILRQGVKVWNTWRGMYPQAFPDFHNADLSAVNLTRANLSGADLAGSILSHAKLINAILSGAILSGAMLINTDLSSANLYGAKLIKSDLSGAMLINADLSQVDLYGAILNEANLTSTNLSGADLSRANLSRANLSKANLYGVILVETNLTGTILNECKIYGISVWNVQLEEAKQHNLVITPPDQPAITVDNLKIAQFIYLLLNNQEIRDVINTIATKVVLILGRFTPERKAVLDMLQKEVRHYNLLPVLFDFTPSPTRDLTETISTLAHISRFIIADLSAAKSIPQELQAIIPHLPSVPIKPILHINEREYAMFEHFKRYPWVLETFYYSSTEHLLASLKEHIIMPADAKAKELTRQM